MVLLITFMAPFQRSQNHAFDLGMQACSFRLHASRSVHKLAVQHYMKPEQPVEILSLDAEDEDLFRGMVPQLDDWVTIWQATRGSFCEAARHLSTARWPHSTRGKEDVTSRAAHSMVSAVYRN